MKTQFVRGTTQENNQLVLPEGMLSVDTEKKALRVHDGVTPGGYEAVGTRAYVPPGPGPESLIAGTEVHGFYGITSAEELISGDDLALLVGISAGHSQFSDAGWLKFALDYKTLFVAKKSIRYYLNYSDLQATNLIFGDTEISIGDFRYKVRLLKGINVPSYPDSAIGYGVAHFDVPITHGSEWNRLMYHVHDGNHTRTVNTLASEGITVGTFAQFSEEELNLKHGSGHNGYTSWCQEYQSDVTSGEGRVVTRGTQGVSSLASYHKSSGSNHYGWRPVLELIH